MRCLLTGLVASWDPAALSGVGFCAQVAPEGEQAPETTAEPAAKLDPDSDEIREKFRIVRVRRLAELAVNSHVLEASPSNNFCALQMQDVVQCRAGTV